MIPEAQEYNYALHILIDLICDLFFWKLVDCLYGLVVRVPGYGSRGPDSILGATTFSEK
jgi:hypothetical protein